MKEDNCIIPQLASGPDTSTAGSGFLTIDDYKNLIQFAAARHIEIIPEVDSPGHARAAIKSMEARYRKLMKTNTKEAAEEYLLTEVGDPSVYFSVQMFNDNAMNPCMNSTYKFMEKIITEIKKMHDEAGQPLKLFHFGGDETSHGAYVNSTICQQFLQTIPKSNDTKFLKHYFVKRVAKIVDDLSLNLAGKLFDVRCC